MRVSTMNYRSYMTNTRTFWEEFVREINRAYSPCSLPASTMISNHIRIVVARYFAPLSLLWWALKMLVGKLIRRSEVDSGDGGVVE